MKWKHRGQERKREGGGGSGGVGGGGIEMDQSLGRRKGAMRLQTCRVLL